MYIHVIGKNNALAILKCQRMSMKYFSRVLNGSTTGYLATSPMYKPLAITLGKHGGRGGGAGSTKRMRKVSW